ncbi:hypothetical protein [Paracoccus aeridis]|uniref:hypothetical protein n=1 Tax=Paracoccus aeridis TaxID=1966466 RepID=UPI001375F02C|nr:hypothetical protein [Paracoccus aeridis]
MAHMPAPAPVSADTTALRQVDAALDRLIALLAEQTAREAAAGADNFTEPANADAPQDT